jgi:HAD superfamily hydrolase (TIGR01509 family)
MGMWKTLAEDYLRSQGVEPGPIFDSDLQTMNLSQGAVFMKKKFGINKTEEEIIAEITANIKAFYLNEGAPKNGAAEMLAELKQAGMRICMATATERPLAEAALARNGLLDYFEFIITNTDVGKGKDDPAIFEKALEKINNTEEKISKAETMIVEDSHIAIRTAVTAGFKACGVYDKHEDILFPEIKETADVTVMSLDELPGVLCI